MLKHEIWIYLQKISKGNTDVLWNKTLFYLIDCDWYSHIGRKGIVLRKHKITVSKSLKSLPFLNSKNLIFKKRSSLFYLCFYQFWGSRIKGKNLILLNAMDGGSKFIMLVLVVKDSSKLHISIARWICFP